MTDHTPPTVAEIAALTARLRALSNAGAATDPAERARFLADKDALIDRITAAERTDDTAELGLTGGEGPPIDAGPALTAEEAAHELAADGRSLPEARALVRDYLDDVSQRVGTSVHRWGLDGADLNDIRAHAATHRPPSDRDEQERRDQLNRWHTGDVDEARDDLSCTDGQE